MKKAESSPVASLTIAGAGNGPTRELWDEQKVRTVMDLTRQALEASGAEIERANRLLRQTEQLICLERGLLD